jgi:hypothetical protein
VPPAGGRSGGDPAPPARSERRRRRRRRAGAGLGIVVLLAAAGAAIGVLTDRGGAPHAVSAYLSADEVRGVAQDFAAAYGHEDVDALRATLAREVERVAPDGAQQGRQDVVAVYRRQFAASDVGSYDLEDLQVIPGAAGRAAGIYTVKRAGRDSLSGRVAFGVIREAGHPRIALIATQPD